MKGGEWGGVGWGGVGWGVECMEEKERRGRKGRKRGSRTNFVKTNFHLVRKASGHASKAALVQLSLVYLSEEVLSLLQWLYVNRGEGLLVFTLGLSSRAFMCWLCDWVTHSVSPSLSTKVGLLDKFFECLLNYNMS
jgi:hypothetical protein